MFVYCDGVDSGQHGAALFTLVQTLQAELGALLFLFRVSGTAVVLHTGGWQVWKAQLHIFGLPA